MSPVSTLAAAIATLGAAATLAVLPAAASASASAAPTPIATPTVAAGVVPTSPIATVAPTPVPTPVASGATDAPTPERGAPLQVPAGNAGVEHHDTDLWLVAGLGAAGLALLGAGTVAVVRRR